MKQGYQMLLLLTLGLLANGCAPSLTVGPQTKQEITIVSTTTAQGRKVEVVQVMVNLRAEVFVTVEEEGKQRVVSDTMELRDAFAWRPDIAIAKKLVAPRVVRSTRVKVACEDGSVDHLDIGGWYITREKSL